MRGTVVLVILVGHLLAIAFGRCQTVWHEDLSGNGIDAAVAEVAHDHDHPHHPTVLFGFGADHDHREETPDHSHVQIPLGVVKALRVQLVVPELISPFAYIELSRVLQPLLEPTRVQFASVLSEAPPGVVPLSGSTTHLLF